MKALVTGSTGFVGAQLVRVLLDAGHSVRALHRASSNTLLIDGLDVETALGDVTDLDALRAASAGCDWVFHVAAVADYWRSDQGHMWMVNVDGTRNVLQAARETGVQRVIFTSSAAAVGFHPQGLPADESIAFNLPPKRFPYGHSKWQAEQIVAEAVASGQDVVTVNPTVIMGPGDLNMISGSFIVQLKRLQWLLPVTSGGVSVIDVRDVARYHIAAAEHGQPGERYLLASANFSYRDWYGLIADVVDAAAPRLYLPDASLPLVANAIEAVRRLGLPTAVDANQVRLGARRVFFDPSKAQATFGPPQVDMRQSVADTHRWYQEQGYIQPDRVSGLIARVGRWL